MIEIDEPLARLKAAADDPWMAVREAKEQGRPVVGCVPYFFPLELVHASGALPVELWGGGKLTGAASSYYPAFYCSVLFTLMERALDGSYDDLDAVVVPTTCDGLRNLEENWKYARTDMEVIDFVQPAVRTTIQSHEYQKGQLERVAKRLSEATGIKVTERAIRESIAAYNRQRAAMRMFSKVAADHVNVIDSRTRQQVFAAARSLPVEEHTALVERLNEALQEQPVCEPEGAKVVLTGVLVDSPSVLSELDSNGLSVVGDLTLSESVRYATDVPGRIDPFDSLATVWEDVRGASVALDPKKERGLMLADLVRERNAQGVVACIVKFCEEEEFDVPVLKQQLDAEGIPILLLEVEMQDAESEQAATRIQAFAELLDA